MRKVKRPTRRKVVSAHTSVMPRMTEPTTRDAPGTTMTSACENHCVYFALFPTPDEQVQLPLSFHTLRNRHCTANYKIARPVGHRGYLDTGLITHQLLNGDERCFRVLKTLFGLIVIALAKRKIDRRELGI
jgi:hypothetical protein